MPNVATSDRVGKKTIKNVTARANAKHAQEPISARAPTLEESNASKSQDSTFPRTDEAESSSGFESKNMYKSICLRDDASLGSEDVAIIESLKVDAHSIIPTSDCIAVTSSEDAEGFIMKATKRGKEPAREDTHSKHQNANNKRDKRQSRKQNDPPVPESEKPLVVATHEHSAQEEVKRESEEPTKPPVIKPSWGEMSEHPDISSIQTVLADELKHCDGFADQLRFLGEVANVMFLLADLTIANERARIGPPTNNEKVFASDIHTLTESARDFGCAITSRNAHIMATANKFANEKATVLDALKSFVLKLAGSDTPPPKPEQTKSSLLLAAQPSQTKPVAQNSVSATSSLGSEGSYALAIGGSHKREEKTDQSIVIARPSGSIDLASVDLGLANMTIPLVRDLAVPSKSLDSVYPGMTIRFSQKFSAFLLNLDGKLYSFSNGEFISRKDKDGEQARVLHGKRCNPNISECNGAECPYYHDPLFYQNGGWHTKRNMSIHYIVSELIAGVATDADIEESANGRNPFLVEDMVQLSGMLLLKAYLVKKMRDSNREARLTIKQKKGKS